MSEQVGVVDQSDVAESGGDGDPNASRLAVVGVEPIDRASVMLSKTAT